MGLIHFPYHVTNNQKQKREMKMKMKKYTLVIVLAMLAGMLSAFAPLPKVDEASIQVATLTAGETDDLLFMIEEEKMAHDLYAAFYVQYGASSFQKISSSEQVHMDELKMLLDSFSIADPTIGNAAGVFSDTDLQALYNQLLAQGSISLAEAFRVGATVEEIDILDLQNRIAQTAQADILGVYTALENGSENHLRAFVRQINNQTGETYTPGHLSAQEFQRITLGTNGNSPQGLQNGQGMQANGRGMQSGLGMPGGQGMRQGIVPNQMQGMMNGNCSGSETCLNN